MINEKIRKEKSEHLCIKLIFHTVAKFSLVWLLLANHIVQFLNLHLRNGAISLKA